MEGLNWLAIVAAAVSAFVIGGLWYGPLFLKADRTPAVEYRDGLIWCPEHVWGGASTARA